MGRKEYGIVSMTGQQLRWFRKLRGLSQTEIGDMLDRTRFQIHSLEISETVPKHIELACAAIALGISEYTGQGPIMAGGIEHYPAPVERKPEKRGRKQQQVAA